MFQFTYAPGRIIVDDPIIISTFFVDLNNIMRLWENKLFCFQLSWILETTYIYHILAMYKSMLIGHQCGNLSNLHLWPSISRLLGGHEYVRINGITKGVSMCACTTNSGLWGMNAVGEEYLQKWHVLNAHINVYCWRKNSHLSWTHDHQLSSAVSNKLPIQQAEWVQSQEKLNPDKQGTRSRERPG